MNKLEETLNSMIKSEGFLLYGTESTKEGDRNIFRVYIKRKEGYVSIDDCVTVTNIISPFLDVEEPMKEKYTLEVSSAGVERKLESERHFELSQGENVEINVISGEKYIGKLLDFENRRVLIDDKTVGEVEIFLADIKKARTKLEF
jgi:ribosome maturation factor RimP